MLVARIHANNQFKAIIKPMRDRLALDVNYANPWDHVCKAELNNCTIKERIQATYQRLPYNQSTHTMVQVLVTESNQGDKQETTQPISFPEASI